MEKLIIDSITTVLKENARLVRIALRQRARFEGWLKFELAAHLEKIGMKNVAVETEDKVKGQRRDITFEKDYADYSVELKTINANWKAANVSSVGKPIKKSFQAVVRDVFRMNSVYGIVAFVLFPIPCGDRRWEAYIQKLVTETEIKISVEGNCNVVRMKIDDSKACDVLICTFFSRTDKARPLFLR